MSNKYAIVHAYGQQFKVSIGDKITTNFVQQPIGTELSFDQVLLVKDNDDVKVGQPLVTGAKVTTTIENHIRDDKILVYKYLKKNRSRKIYGHKQPHSVLLVKDITY